MKHLTIKPAASGPPTKPEHHSTVPDTLPDAKETKVHPSNGPAYASSRTQTSCTPATTSTSAQA
jgi:hypothetical protein